MSRFTLFTLLLTLPTLVFGQVTYQPLIQGGGLETDSIGAYINSLYLISISIAALLATIKLIIAGAKYMLSDVVTTQGEAKKEIQSSLLGLLLVISAVLILTIINPQLISNQLTLTRVEQTAPLPTDTPPRAAGDLRGPNGEALPQEKFNSCTNIQTKCGDSQCDSDRPDYKRISTCILPVVIGETGAAQRANITAAFKKECEDKGGTFTAGTNPSCTSGTSNANVKNDPKVKTYNTVGTTGGAVDPDKAAAAKADCEENFGVYFQETTQGKCALPKNVVYSSRYKVNGALLSTTKFREYCEGTLKGTITKTSGIGGGFLGEVVCLVK